jgi:hypothetical protein
LVGPQRRDARDERVDVDTVAGGVALDGVEPREGVPGVEREAAHEAVPEVAAGLRRRHHPLVGERDEVVPLVRVEESTPRLAEASERRRCLLGRGIG